VGVACRSIAESATPLVSALGLTDVALEEVPSQKARMQFLAAGETHVELLESTSPDGPIAKFIEKRGEGLHHIALLVSDLDVALTEARAAGLRLVDEFPRPGARGARIAFLHPKSTGGVLIELVERPTPNRQAGSA